MADGPPLENATPDFLLSPVGTVIGIIETYGWFILVGAILLAYLYQKYKPVYKSYLQKQQDLKEQEEAKKNPDKTYELQLSVEQSRLKLQEKVKQDAEKKKLRQQQLENEKRKEKIEEWESIQQGRSYSKKTSTDTKDTDSTQQGTLKPKKKDNMRNTDYNPLMGGGGSCSYRPGRRNVSGGG